VQALRQRQPVLALVLAIAAAAILPANASLILPALVVLYTIARSQPWRAAALGGVLVALVASVAEIAWGHQANTHWVVIGTITQCAAAVAIGLYTGARYKVLEGLRERAERLARESELLTARAVTEERLRIARELHDAVAHNVSLMVVQAQALGATARDEHVSASTDAIADLGRQAMTEMNQTLKLLRANDTQEPELSPQPGLGNLDVLVQQSRNAGLHVDLIIDGEPHQLSPSVDLSAFRIIQEALTNVIKHAAGARVSITLAYRPRGLELEIVDNGPSSPNGLASDNGAGSGVMGMRERANLFGGTLTAEPRPDHGFAVTATLPYVEPSP